MNYITQLVITISFIVFFGNYSFLQTVDSAWPGSDLGTLSCPSTTTLTGTTASAATNCAVSSVGDHIYKFTLSTATDVVISTCSGTTWDTELHLFNFTNGNCNSGSIAYSDQFCGDQSEITSSCLAAGSYVVVLEGYSGAKGAYTLTITTSNCGGCVIPANDDPCNATLLNVGQACSYTTYSNALATSTVGVTAPGCGSYSGGDVWFKFVVPTSGKVIIDTKEVGTMETDMAVYSGTCGSLTLIECDDSDSDNGLMAKISRTGLTPGVTIWIRVWEYGNNDKGSFKLCIYEPGPCGNGNTNDYCSNPAILTYSPSSSWSSSTSAIFSADQTQLDFGTFCGSIENNSWYQFTATATTHTFNFTTVNHCTFGTGIQAQVFSVTKNGSGCCTAFTSKSNCMNPGVPASGTVTATSLTIGNNYMLMVDGESGDHCDFKVSDWSAVGILPIELISFSGIKEGTFNTLFWETASEFNNDYFDIEKTEDGILFSKIGRVNGKGNATEIQQYIFKDEFVKNEIEYYRLKQVDFDGKHTYSDIISIYNQNGINGAFNVFPNPVKTKLFIISNSQISQKANIEVYNFLGMQILNMEVDFSKGINKLSIDVLPFAEGIYSFRIVNIDGKIVENGKFQKLN